MEPFHVGCPYTSLPICHCSLYIREPPRYLQSATALDTECGDDERTNLQRALLQDIMLAAGGDGSNPYGRPPSPRTLLAAKAATIAPEEELAETLAVAMHAAKPPELLPVTNNAQGGSTPTSSSTGRGRESSPSDSKQAASSSADAPAMSKRVRHRPRKTSAQ